MLIRTRKASEANENEVTPLGLYLNRRAFLEAGQAVAAGGLLATLGGGVTTALAAEKDAKAGKSFAFPYKKNARTLDEKSTSYKDVTSYNNFYEFGTDKSDPAANAHTLKPTPWSVRIEGEVEKSFDMHLEDLMKAQSFEERIYRLRCVEGWSMVIPWIGFPLASLIQKAKPTSKAKYVEFTTLKDTVQMPGQKRPVLDWPYVEGLRMDEALHPLTLMAVGLYGEVLPNQNGAPLRLVVPWKYGFKCIKSIVKIRFVTEQPESTWTRSAPKEYGFYSNVNPAVDHPRWSQASERRIGDFLRRKTLLFNGYGEEVASLYSGLDLKRNF